jgi:hypothetical protein
MGAGAGRRRPERLPVFESGEFGQEARVKVGLADAGVDLVVKTSTVAHLAILPEVNARYSEGDASATRDLYVRPARFLALYAFPIFPPVAIVPFASHAFAFAVVPALPGSYK